MSQGGSPLYTQRTLKHIMETFSPTRLHVLVVDDDPLCLVVLERMLKQCRYKVTTCNRVNTALELLRKEGNDFDLVISDVYMPDEDGFKLLEVIGLELDLPVIMISANGDFSVVMKGVIHGACDYLIKPVRIEELRNIWQHVIRRKRKDFRKPEHQREDDMEPKMAESQEYPYKKRKEVLELPELSIVEDLSSPKKPRVSWSVELHQRFVNAVNQLGIDQAVPKKILRVMNVQGLNRENIASHLQKYRLYLKRLSGVMPGPCPVASFQASDDGTAGGTMLIKPGRKATEPVTSVKGLNLGAGLGPKRGMSPKVNAGTLESLSQLKTFQQKQAANRAQVFSAIGVGEPPLAVSSSSGGLLRMASLDLDFLCQGQQPKEEVAPCTPQGADVVDDLATRSSSRVVKLEDDELLLGSASAKSIYRVTKQIVRDGSVVHDFSMSRSFNQEGGINSTINLAGDMLTHDPGSSSIPQLDEGEGPPHVSSPLLVGLSEEAMKFRGDAMISNNSNLHYSYGSLFHVTPGLQANVRASRLPSINEQSATDCGQDELQPIEGGVAKEAMVVGEAISNANVVTKVSYVRCMGTEASGESCSFDALMSGLGIGPTGADEVGMQQSTSELLDMDQYLQLN